jgi:phage protein U
MNWGALGDIVFEPMAGPLDETHKWAVDIAEHALIGRKPRLQMTGPKLQELTLRIRLHTSTNANPELDLRVLKDSMEAGEILDLVVGEQSDLGLWAGQWMLTTIDIGAVERWPGGRIRNAEVTLTLKEWVEPADLQVSARKNPPKAVRPNGKTAPPSIQSKIETNRDGFSVPVSGQ